jgi:heptosyltransferase-2
MIRWFEDQHLKKQPNPKKLLIVPDINIGDALNHQSFAEILKKHFPESEIHYIYKKKAFSLIQANPYIDVHHPLFQTSGIPSKPDLDLLKKVIIKNNYDVIFNFCPYMPFSVLRHRKTPVINPIRLMGSVIRACGSINQKAHLAWQLNQFGEEIASRINPSSSKDIINKDDTLKQRLYTRYDLYLRAEKTAQRLGIFSENKIVFFNPDSSSPYTLIPIKMQAEIMKAALSMPQVGQVIMNKGLSYKNIENNILDQLPSDLKRKIILMSMTIPLDIYAALTDKADVFISADTGPMHISAAEKVITDSEQKFRNQTAVIGLFGATPSKLYGYDSFSDEHLDSSQNAPAKAFEGNPRCKNITCVDKAFKKCSYIKCFEGIDTKEVIRYIETVVKG